MDTVDVGNGGDHDSEQFGSSVCGDEHCSEYGDDGGEADAEKGSTEIDTVDVDNGDDHDSEQSGSEVISGSGTDVHDICCARVPVTIHAVAPSLWKRACAQKQRQLLRLFKGLGYGRSRHGRGRRRRDKSKVVDCHGSENVKPFMRVDPVKDYRLQTVQVSDPGCEL